MSLFIKREVLSDEEELEDDPCHSTVEILEYEQRIIVDTMDGDAIFIHTRGLGMERLFLKHLIMYSDQKPLALVLNTSQHDELLPVYCGACKSLSPQLWETYFTQGIHTYCEKMTGSPQEMKFEESLINSIQNFVDHGKSGIDSTVVRIFKVTNKYGCRYMKRLVKSVIENVVSKNDKSSQKTCQMFYERKHFFCAPHYEPYVAWGEQYIKPVVFCAFSVR